MTDSDRVLSREERIEEFGEEEVERMEWWRDEMERVQDAMDELLAVVRERDDLQLAQRGRSVGRDGEHTLRFRAKVAGEPWQTDGDGGGEGSE